jgi:hypothetical protein
MAHGKEAVIYLIFMKHASYYFFFISLVCCISLWPVYMNGNGETEDVDVANHSRMTLENVLGDESA